MLPRGVFIFKLPFTARFQVTDGFGNLYQRHRSVATWKETSLLREGVDPAGCLTQPAASASPWGT